MHGSLFLPLLSLLLSALPAVLCVDDVQGTPTLIFESSFGDAKNPLLASVEVERLTNIKGNRSEVVGVLGVGYTVAPTVSKDATTGVDYLEFFPPASPPTLPTGVCGVKPGFGGGEVVYYPFRLDHNTVYNNKAQPVEDNGWIFSWRAAWGAMRTQNCGATTNPLYANSDPGLETIYDQLNNAWQVVYSFPAAAGVNNLVVAQRTRAPVGGVTPIELGVFIASDPTGTQTQVYASKTEKNPLTAYPVALFPIPQAKVINNQWRSYVLYVPMPDRSPVFKVVGSFYASTGDYPGVVTTGYAPADWTTGAKNALKTIFQRQIETQWAIWQNAFTTNGASTTPLDGPIEAATIAANSARVAWTFVDSEASFPTAPATVGTYSFAFEIRRGADFPYLDNFIRHFVKSYSIWLKTQFTTTPYTWDTVSVKYRAKGALRGKDITFWFDGERVEQLTYQMVPPKNLMNWLRVATTDNSKDAWSELWLGGDGIFAQVWGFASEGSLVAPLAGFTKAFEFETNPEAAAVSIINHEPSGSYGFYFTLNRLSPACTNNVDYTVSIATSLANAGRRFLERMVEWSAVTPIPVFPTTAYGFTGVPNDDAYLGFTSRSHFDVKQRYTNVGGNCRLHVVIRFREPEDGLGEFMVLNSDVDTGFTTKRQAPVVATPFTGPFFVLGAHPTSFATKPDVGLENYRGIVQNLRLGDVRIYTSSATNAAKSVTESFLKTLVECGDGQLDAGEVCDKSDKSCTGDCTCPLRTVPKAPKGCTYCGNGVIDYLLGEVCDVFEDSWCASNCTACSQPGMVVDEVQLPSNGVVTQVKGRCTFCGNGKLDINNGEICDKKDPNCNADCKSCKAGWFATGNSVGSCFRCGNKVLDAGEVCDIGFNAHVCSSDCSSCRAGYIPDGLGSCTACGNGVVDAGEACDKALTACKSDCTACVEFHVPGPKGCTRCGNGRLDAGEMCDAANPNCKSDCSGCINSRVPSEDALGTCTMCGNGRIDANGDFGLPEACDADPNCLGCNDCRTPYVLSKQGGTCVLCGNGRLDAGEVCDAAQMGCDSSCLSCGEDWMSLADADANPTGLCFPTTCSEAPGADGECTCQ